MSAHIQLQVKAKIALSICFGSVCGGLRASGFWEAAAGVDMALTTTHGIHSETGASKSGLDADGCREYTFQSKLTKYAEYPQLDGVSNLVPPAHSETRETMALCVSFRPWAALRSLPCRDAGFRSQFLIPSPLCRADITTIGDIMVAAEGGLALVGGYYFLPAAFYVTVPYIKVEPIASLGGSCGVASDPLLSYGGPGDCTVNNEGTCESEKTFYDTMGDKGWQHPYGAMLWRRSWTFGTSDVDVVAKALDSPDLAINTLVEQ